MSVKIGNTIIMHFHCAGVVLDEEWEVTDVSDKHIYLENWIFDKTSGRCINDDNTFGARRTIDPIK